jgi:hypothetical protein
MTVMTSPSKAIVKRMILSVRVHQDYDECWEDLSDSRRNVRSSLLERKHTKGTIKQSHYRPWQALRVPGVWGFQILRQSAHEGGKVVSPTHRPPLPQKIFLVLISVRGWVDARSIVRPEGLCQWKNRVTPSRRKHTESYKYLLSFTTPPYTNLENYELSADLSHFSA